MSREQLLVAALRRGLDASGHAMTCEAVERFNAWARAMGKAAPLNTADVWATFKPDCNCWRKQAQEALDAA